MCRVETENVTEEKQSSPWIDPTKINEICEIIRQHFVGATTRPARRVEEVVKEAYEFVDDVYGRDAAI